MTTSSQGGSVVVEVVLGLVAAAIVFTTVTGRRLPFLATDRAAFIALVVVGVALCGMGMRIGTYGWVGPFQLLGMLIGLVALAVIGAVFFGIKVPYITSDRAAIIALGAIIGLKFVVAIVRALATKAA